MAGILEEFTLGAASMMKYLNDALDAATGMPVDSVLGGVFLALMLTSPVGLAYVVGRRRGKDVSITLIALATVTNLIGMAVAIGHAKYVEDRRTMVNVQTSFGSGFPPPQVSPNQGSRPPGRSRLSDIIAERITPGLLSKGDTDRDGRLSTG